MSGENRRTQIYEIHRETAKLTVFAGFEMPLYYKDITPEHLAVRNGVGIFDISHMGRVLVTGIDAENFLNYVITNDVSTLQPNAAQYSVMCNENGGIMDDFVVYRLEDEKFLAVFNASNREKDYNWLVKNAKRFNVKIEEVSDDVAMFAVQGPNAEKTLQKIATEDLSKIGRFKCKPSKLAGVEVFLSRTGYTGEDGFEVFVWNASIAKPENALRLWKAILKAGETLGIEPCGLGARDTLRLEAGLCLYGNDIDETTTPLEATLGFVVKLQKDRFIGKEVLLKQKAEGVKRKRVGIRMTDRGIPRPGFEIRAESGERIGNVTSGTFSPLLNFGIGMGYVQTPHAQEGNIVNVIIRNKTATGRIAAFPFYDIEKYGFKRRTATV
ncbi:MAG TPA: glycine cleavage system aminomethyltransferase GcvT [candidate division Zixibacteria bacterium]|nr:glycine cleavage system aminomethyltransferase GcvT [candidate division Zixibacteria bacterium]